MIRRKPQRTCKEQYPMTTPAATDASVMTSLEESFASSPDVPCECEHPCDDASCDADHRCGEPATRRVTTPCDAEGCPNAGAVLLLCEECAAQRIDRYGEGRATARELRR
jgi:hypothetical protein